MEQRSDLAAWVSGGASGALVRQQPSIPLARHSTYQGCYTCPFHWRACRGHHSGAKAATRPPLGGTGVAALVGGMTRCSTVRQIGFRNLADRGSVRHSTYQGCCLFPYH
eukprot:991518-Pyramimonas_sp.AAC.3